VGGNAGSKRPRRTFLKIGEVLEKGQVKSSRNRRACLRNLMTLEEAKGVCKDRSKWKEAIPAYPKGKRALCYVSMYSDGFHIKNYVAL
jgi:hypothetical protein